MRPWQNWAIVLSSLGILGSWYKWGYHPDRIEKKVQAQREEYLRRSGVETEEEYIALERIAAAEASPIEPTITVPPLPEFNLPPAPQIFFYPPGTGPGAGKKP